MNDCTKPLSAHWGTIPAIPKQTPTEGKSSTYLPARTLCCSLCGLVVKSSFLADLQQEIEIDFTKPRSLGESANDSKEFPTVLGRQCLVYNETTLSLGDSNCQSKVTCPIIL